MTGTLNPTSQPRAVTGDGDRTAHEHVDVAAATRLQVARSVLAVVTQFAPHPPQVPEEADVLAVERAVRALAGEAETRSVMVGPGRTQVLYQALDEQYLLEDYLRIVEVTQHDAFGEPDTPQEHADRAAHAVAVAARAAEQVARREQMRLAGMAVCRRCGHDRARHWRNCGREVWEPVDTAVHHRFEDITDAPLANLRPTWRDAAVQAWLVNLGVRLDRTQTSAVTAVLGELAAGRSALTLGQGLRVVARVLDLPAGD